MWVPEEPKLTVAQLKTIVDICVGFGNLGMGSVVIPALFDKWSPSFVISGLLVAFGSWLAAILISRRI